jgi:hypothetical protein
VRTFQEMANSASSVQVCMVPDCDHQFRGEVNGRIMSSAPLWAFTDEVARPEPSMGIKLYD